VCEHQGEEGDVELVRPKEYVERLAADALHRAGEHDEHDDHERVARRSRDLPSARDERARRGGGGGGGGGA
jgi:hypothetical protein